MNQQKTIDGYFAEFGEFHAHKAAEMLEPLHRPGIDPVPDFSTALRQPFDGQAAAIAAAVKMLNTTRRGTIAAEMGTGKTIMGMLSIHAHAAQSARKGGRNGKYRAIVLCPDHLIKKWRDEIEETVPGATAHTFDAGERPACVDRRDGPALRQAAWHTWPVEEADRTRVVCARP